MLKVLFRILAFLWFAPHASALEKVVLQLKWEHEFQFAGYYAANWQGYYKDAGLDVDIRPAMTPNGKILKPLEEIESGRADFAIGALDILIGKDRGQDPVILAPFFQRSPNALFSLKSTPIENLSQLVKLKIAAVNDSAVLAEIEALFKARGFDLDQLHFVDVPVTVNSLIEGKADVISTYEVSALYQAKEKGIQLNKLHPNDYGVNFFSDTLFTSKSILDNRPETVQRFIKATKKGWLYALNNKEEIASRISVELPRHLINYDNLYDYNLAFSELIESFLNYPQVPIGYINQERWVTMNETLRSIGIVRSHIVDSDIFYAPPKEKNKLNSPIFSFLIGLFLFFIILNFWYRRMLIPTLISLTLLAFFLASLIETNIKKEQLKESEINLTRQISSISARLKGNLETNLSMLTGFAAYISAHPDITEKEFRKYAKEVFKKETMIINFASAKNLVINYIYPLKGNTKAIGLNYREHPTQKEVVMQVIRTGQLLVDGPVELIQGGIAFIGRAPIYTGDGSDRKLWGIISSPLDAELLYQYSGINTLPKDMHFAIKSFSSFDSNGKIVFGKNETFNHPNHVKQIISVGGGTWHIGAIPTNISDEFNQYIFIVRSISVVVLCLMLTFVIFRFNQEKEKKELQSQIQVNQRLLENVGEVARIGGWKINRQLQFTKLSNTATKLIDVENNFQPDSLFQLQSILSKQDAELWEKKIQAAFEKKQAFDIEVELNAATEQSKWVRIISTPNKSEDNNNVLTGTIQDITAKIKDAKIIQHQATYDALTDLPNRMLFNDRLNQAIERANRTETKIAVFFIDLDRFKPVNDNHGHQAGDQLLIQAALRILPCVRKTDTVSRLSGDEFGVILVDINQSKDSLHVIEQIHNSLQIPYQINEASIHCSASIGVAFYPEDGVDAESLIRNADQAMYVVKSSGRNGWQFYTEQLQLKSEYRHKMLNKLIDAIEQSQLSAYYQPIVDLATNKIVKCESLSRWQQSDGSFIPPTEFIALAEETGLVNKIDISMLRNASGALLQLNNIEPLKLNVGLSINVSPRLFHTKDKALDTWLECIKSICPHLDLTVEITERLLTDDTEKALDVLNQLKNLGVKIAIDDFGTGYSSLSYLVKFPVDIIKIDKSFIESIGNQLSAETLIQTIIVMAKKLDIQVIAEGIETEAQLSFLIQHGCDFGQGYYLGKPMTRHQFQQLLNSDSN